MNLADTINGLATDVAAIKTQLASMPAGSIDLTPVETAVAGVQTTVDAIKAELTPSPLA